MPIILYILIFNFLGSIVSLVGGVMILLREKLILRISHLLASFAAGSLLGAAFFDLLPEAQAEGGGTNIFLWTLVGILSFFLLERFLHWFHHHGQHEEKELKPTVPLIILGDSVHNFIDGIAIATTFMVSIPLGIITTFAVAAHEIPQEIGDFGLLLHKGLKKKKILFLNFVSAVASVAGALIAFYFGRNSEALLPIFLSLTAGLFIYIATSDLIPEIHHENRKNFAFYETAFLFSGVFVIWLSVFILKSLNLE